MSPRPIWLDVEQPHYPPGESGRWSLFLHFFLRKLRARVSFPYRGKSVCINTSSRTSVRLARVILERRYAAEFESVSHAPDLEAMLRAADAALVIGDPALRIDPARLPYFVYDLGAEWVEMTGLPMVFAVWAGRREVVTPAVVEAFRASSEYGLARIEEIVAAEAPSRAFPPETVREYLTRNIVHELGPREYAGLELFLKLAREPEWPVRCPCPAHSWVKPSIRESDAAMLARCAVW